VEALVGEHLVQVNEGFHVIARGARALLCHLAVEKRLCHLATRCGEETRALIQPSIAFKNFIPVVVCRLLT
jgi:hypothetical protein